MKLARLNIKHIKQTYNGNFDFFFSLLSPISLRIYTDGNLRKPCHNMAVSCQHLTVEVGFDPRPVHVGLMVVKRTM